ncbi:MAG: hypothetical protein JXR37_37675 [Kiritimatiellae bacterium]|nr:hypothetical protein [Kiritimatiellia bacterium]
MGRQRAVMERAGGRVSRRLSRFITRKTLYEPLQPDVLLANLNQLLKRASGSSVVLEDTPQNLERAVFLFRNGTERIQFKSRYDTKISVVDAGFKDKALKFGPYQRCWDGPRLRYAPVDISGPIRGGGFLRFYVNTDRGGEHQRHSMWLTMDGGPGGAVQNEGEEGLVKGVYLDEFVDIDPFPDTWQLVSIPLSRLCAEGMQRCKGLNVNFTADGQKPLYFSRIYAIDNVAPAPVPYEGKAVPLSVSFIGRSLADILSGAGMVSQLRYEASIDGTGALTNAVLNLHIQEKGSGAKLGAVDLVNARVLDLPWTTQTTLAKELEKQVAGLDCVVVLSVGNVAGYRADCAGNRRYARLAGGQPDEFHFQRRPGNE